MFSHILVIDLLWEYPFKVLKGHDKNALTPHCHTKLSEWKLRGVNNTADSDSAVSDSPGINDTAELVQLFLRYFSSQPDTWQEKEVATVEKTYMLI